MPDSNNNPHPGVNRQYARFYAPYQLSQAQHMAAQYNAQSQQMAAQYNPQLQQYNGHYQAPIYNYPNHPQQIGMSLHSMFEQHTHTHTTVLFMIKKVPNMLAYQHMAQLPRYDGKVHAAAIYQQNAYPRDQLRVVQRQERHQEEKQEQIENDPTKDDRILFERAFMRPKSSGFITNNRIEYANHKWLQMHGPRGWKVSYLSLMYLFFIFVTHSNTHFFFGVFVDVVL